MVNCSDPGHVENGVRQSGLRYPEVFSYGVTVTIHCKRGFYLLGSALLTCQHDGRWDRPIPHCLGMDRRIEEEEDMLSSLCCYYDTHGSKISMCTNRTCTHALMYGEISERGGYVLGWRLQLPVHAPYWLVCFDPPVPKTSPRFPIQVPTNWATTAPLERCQSEGLPLRMAPR